MVNSQYMYNVYITIFIINWPSPNNKTYILRNLTANLYLLSVIIKEFGYLYIFSLVKYKIRNNLVRWYLSCYCAG